MKRVELLSPAGNYETMVGAFNAGADAVYLGGSKFGARAYADNFDRDQVLDAIGYAHINGKKIYMTVNTLVKEREFGELYGFMLPFAEKKLDGVIVQDYGVMRFIRQEFPGIELHASTQQTVTGVYGAKLLKELGCCRVVPARELSLEEMKRIRTEADIEVEAFIHGAMCYCYSGVCLFSSMVGGRSGNRGRCAQPCRLPYRLSGDRSGKEQYPLSLKDMCTVDMIPELIEAGIDSFKIEGRMKKPEYSAGVTSLYRKYIDLYYREPDKKHDISREDMDILKSLYLRTGISQGYYYKHNGKDMVTIDSPAYNGTSDKVLAEVKDRFLDHELKIKCDIDCQLTLAEEAVISMSAYVGDQILHETVRGKKVEAASKRPMDKDSVLKQLSRLGNTPFEAENINVNIDDGGSGTGIFVPVSELNELRRELCEKMQAAIEGMASSSVTSAVESGIKTGDRIEDIYADTEVQPGILDVLVTNAKQLKTIAKIYDKADYKVPGRIYVDSNIFFSSMDETGDIIRKIKEAVAETEVILALPFVTRHEDLDATQDLDLVADSFVKYGFDGVLIRNLEQLGFFKQRGFTGKVILDYGMYNWNAEAVKLLLECNSGFQGGFNVSEISIPLELTIHETKELVKEIRKNTRIPVSYCVYGKVPMMVSAGCVRKTMDNCSGGLHKHHSETIGITDRMDNELVITTNCRNCYNVIWNAHPTALHKKYENIVELGIFNRLRIDFTTEDAETAEAVYEAFAKDMPAKADIFDKISYTTGHYKRGVE
ncbi:U32 family peptidase [Butyrivibrio sp. DSM 10294]|uniref:U32 family peptidase n=1 Tax=Butyrivibrio sp. DSM 10294 TaxID=2972457 RepID=UPI00234EB08E|nr:U32 family peptidase [Butyrivibrio sp. DSM 10294]MDC7293965.1 U32 family peptidase [Butyrivibrio sp. DSM 10294]